MEMSCSPSSSSRTTSLRRICGSTASAPERIRSSTASRYALNRKKWLRSRVRISSRVGCSMQCPLTIWASVLNSSQPEAQIVNGHCIERSEEHTSELQSRGHLVCRLLLEKKKKKTKTLTQT